ncbi:TLC domain-containing protein 4-like [Branchiostoma lanceolatum]|uniref:TMEM56 protein n=2 Tax=Branchiostoma lanceolatum TaxID=7740 RepID=A0A8K0A2S5_BRALA|nr:TMEM56 [Branchiostoma lanceolatum]
MAVETIYPLVSVCSFLTWLLVFRLSREIFGRFSVTYRAMSREKQVSVDDNFKVICHAIPATILSWYTYMCTELPPGGVWFDSPWVRLAASMYMGYACTDLLLMALHTQLSTKLYVAHHCMSLYCSFIGMFYPCMAFYGNITIMMELSNPSVFLRYLLMDFGYKKTKLYVVNGVVMLVTFFIARVVVTAIGTFNLVKVMATQDDFYELPLQVSLCYVSGCLLFNSLNYYWFVLMCQGFVKHISGKKD